MKKLIIGILLMMSTSLASAAYIALDEGATLQTGTISYDGNGGALVGTDILFTSAFGGGTSLNSSVAIDCAGCLLNFITGANTVEGPALWQWGAGGSVVLTGTLMQGLTQIATGNLLTGVFTGTPTAVGGGGNGLFAGVGIINVNQDLLDFYGVQGNGFDFATTELALGTCQAAGGSGGFSCGLQNADFALQSAAVPVPGTLFLFGAGLLAIRRAIMRKQT